MDVLIIFNLHRRTGSSKSSHTESVKVSTILYFIQAHRHREGSRGLLKRFYIHSLTVHFHFKCTTI